jgi:hypothetical protein
MVLEALAGEAIANFELLEQLDGVVFEQSGSDALLDVLAGVGLEDDRLDALALQQQREGQAGWTSADDADLRPHSRAYVTASA